MKTLVLAITIFGLAAPGVAQAQADDIRQVRVHFAKGAGSTVIEDSITGYETVDHILGASAGQLMNVGMATDNGANYFNILPPGETDVAIFNGSVSDNQYEGVLPESGDYAIRVYMMRSAARRNEVANYRLEMIINAGNDQPSDTGDALVPGTEYQASGMVPCAGAASQPAGQCGFGVVREGNGSGTVVIARADGRTRAIFFEGGEPVGSDASEADGEAFSATREGDLNIIRIGEERYEIPDAVILGG